VGLTEQRNLLRHRRQNIITIITFSTMNCTIVTNGFRFPILGFFLSCLNFNNTLNYISINHNKIIPYILIIFTHIFMLINIKPISFEQRHFLFIFTFQSFALSLSFAVEALVLSMRVRFEAYLEQQVHILLIVAVIACSVTCALEVINENHLHLLYT